MEKLPLFDVEKVLGDVSRHVFKSFKDHKDGFKESLQKDVKGMVSLYDASFLAFEDEILLEKAKSFTRVHLKNQKGVTISLAKEVNHALEMPLICTIECQDWRLGGILMHIAKRKM
ncbi:hypothetical protein LguiA_022656 [Lonicera macranthoides]